MPKKILLTPPQVTRKIERLALEVKEKTFGFDSVFLVGIESGGYIIAEQMKTHLTEPKFELYSLSIDKQNPLGSIRMARDLPTKENAILVIIDDVLNSGKTMLHALIHLVPKITGEILVAVLVDRFHRTYPIRSDIRGIELSTSLQDHIQVDFSNSKDISVYLN